MDSPRPNMVEVEVQVTRHKRDVVTPISRNPGFTEICDAWRKEYVQILGTGWGFLFSLLLSRTRRLKSRQVIPVFMSVMLHSLATARSIEHVTSKIKYYQ